MLEFRGRFQWPWKKKDPYVNPDLDPVILVPGIGGSILLAVNEKGHRERIWVRLFAADHEFKSKLWSLFDPETGGVFHYGAISVIPFTFSLLILGVILRIGSLKQDHDISIFDFEMRIFTISFIRCSQSHAATFASLLLCQDTDHKMVIFV